MAGDEKNQSFLKSLFAGEVLQDLVFPYPVLAPQAQEDLRTIVNTFREFARDHIDSVAIDRQGYIAPEVFAALKELGFFGLTVPEKYGGAGLSLTAYGRVLEEICSVDASLGVSLGGHLSIGSKGLVMFGSDEQKEKYLPKIASGEYMTAFALTEAGAGSDAAGIQSKAVLNPERTHFILNGGKIWITNGGLAHLFTVFAKTPMTVGGEVQDKITAFIVERSFKGFSSGKPEEKLGIHGSNTTALNFDNVPVPADNMLGQMGRGFKIAMEILNTGRLGLASGCLGGCKALLKLATAHAKNRKQFGRPIAAFEMIQDKIARMAADTHAAESMVYLTTALADRPGVDYSLESAACKIFVSETLWRVVNEAMQIAGGIGYSREYPYEQALRDARINLIFEGTNEILRAFIALAGMEGPGEYLKQIGRALRDPIKGFGLLTGYAVGKVKDKVAHDHLSHLHPQLQAAADRFNDMAGELHGMVEKTLMKHGKSIIQRQFLQKRLADAVIDLYAMVAVLSRVDTLLKQRHPHAGQEVLLANRFVEEAWRRVRRNLRQMESNSDDECKRIAEMVYDLNGYHWSVYN
ncbi:MAG: acyl-CoA dehydrogenase family protein [candidate division KSB1 bacterium]|nr:acyl-CoA dehydrogenase family protein [candidate division KSB1 bacterium]MDZ7276528.1 acyl-CoA dehydrogenase family protein [candidate division KSB1 bacterium]MDZ7286692.1 acyl-CoA dehydrogenase family protein [candidate division KSB1 bacterium]MDZ7300297.1 acyl-CoA dehydrogenase family protein [candidate division KSB1 bacterium]MDZ7309482.1 acyl-CoA dehydrogenase family protein [candidate division KSB1 bacterium]